MRGLRRLIILAAVLAPSVLLASHALGGAPDRSLDGRLAQRLSELGFTGQIESTLTTRLGRPLDPRLANIGRLLWFDTITGLNNDNTCAGCHSPTNGFGDSLPIAIGIDNNGIVGPDRTGPRSMRRAPMVDGDVARRGDGCCPRAVADQCDLAEILAGAARADVFAVDAVGDRSLADHVEAEAGLAFGQDRIALGEGPLL